MANHQRRFIAGAVCPSCGVTDTVFILKGDERISRHCSRCNFEEILEAPDEEWGPVRVMMGDNLKKT